MTGLLKSCDPVIILNQPPLQWTNQTQLTVWEFPVSLLHTPLYIDVVLISSLMVCFVLSNPLFPFVLKSLTAKCGS